MASVVVVTDYDPDWPELFQSLQSRIAQTLGTAAALIEHVGSTAVPGLAAKPIIDIDVLLVSTDSLPIAIDRLATIGYLHQGNLGIAEREAFLAPQGLFPHHLYVCPPNSIEFRRHLAFRDYLRAHPDVVKEYGELKRMLAAQFRNERSAYIAGKEAFVEELTDRAMAANPIHSSQAR